MQDVTAALQAGETALKTADWRTAKTSFEQVLQAEALPQAHDGLGIACWWLNEIEMAHYHRILAYNGFKERGEFGRAAFIATWLGREQIFLHGNVMAMQGWFARAERLWEQVAPSLDSTWCVMLRASLMEAPQGLESIASQTIDLARTYKDSNLEAFALAFWGSAQVALGRVEEGMTHLDEAMTMVMSGEVSNFMTISEVFCVMLSACETAHDLVRCEHWCRVASEFAQRHHSSFLSAYCRTTYGSLLTAQGRWQDAEQALTEAIQTFESGHKGLRVHAVIKLADLRVYQGRFEEAEVMLEGLEDQGSALLPLARLHMAKGELPLAKAVLEQGLPPSQNYTIGQLPLLLLLLEVLLKLDDLGEVLLLMASLRFIAQQTKSPLLAAQVELAQGQVDLHMGQVSAAKEHFNTALSHLNTYEQSLLAGQVRLEMARTLQSDDPHGAIAWAKAAVATFERIGASQETAKALHLLRQLGAISGSRSQQHLTEREAEIISLIAQGLTNREIADRLVISPKTVEHHVGHILTKLNLRSRAEAAAFAASGKLTSLQERK